MKRRYTINDQGFLVDREGAVLGRVVGITIDDSVGDIGGASVSSGEQQSLGERTDPVAPQGAASRQQLDAEIIAVWATYVEAMEPRSHELDAEGRKIIREALKVASVEECQRAVRGCKASPFHMGDNQRRKKYNRLSQILKGKRGGKTTREQIDMFLEIAERAGVHSRVTSADPARVSAAKRDVLDGFEFPNDEHAVRRAAEAENWLMENGVVIEREDSGRPTFRWADA